MFQPRWARRVAFALAVALLWALGATGARAQEAGGVGGYSLLARANPLQITYDSPGLLPVSPIVQVSVPEALSTLSTGPTGYSLSSLAWPGPLVADLGSVLTQTSPECQPPFPVPTYPVRAEAFFPSGPLDSDASPVPGSRMRSTASGPASTAFGALSDVVFPTIFSLGSITGRSSTLGEGEAATTTARSVVGGFSMLGGLVQIDSIITDVTASSTGEAGAATKTQGSTRVTGATIAGQAVTIDEKGVTLAGSALGGLGELLQGLGPTLSELLTQAGITIKVLAHQENKDEGLAERIAGGLLIDLNYNGLTTPIISQLLAAIPTNQLPADNATECAPSSPQGIVNLFKETHIISFALGGATVSSNASAAFGLPSLGAAVTIPGLELDTGVLPDSFSAPDLSSGGTNGGGQQVGSGALTNTGNVAGPGRATAAALVVLMLAMFPLLAAMTRRFADATLAAPTASTCPLDPEGESDG